MKTQHTPTPWLVVEGDNQPYTFIKDGKGGMFDNGIASLVSNQRKENAAFIVRACNSHEELLETLKKTHNKLNDVAARLENLHKILSREIDAFLPVIEQAIANAERES